MSSFQLTKKLSFSFISVYGLINSATSGRRFPTSRISRYAFAGLASIATCLTPSLLAQTRTAALEAVECSSSNLLPRNSVSCIVKLSAPAPAEGVVVALNSSNGTVDVPASVSVQSGKSTAAFTATSSEAAGDEVATVTAAAGSVRTAVTLAQISTNTPLELVSKSSGKCLAERGSGYGVDQTTCAGSEAQKWLFKANSDGSYEIESPANSLVLEGVGVAGKPGEGVIVWQPYATTSQKWKLQSAGTGYYSLTVEATHMCLGVLSSANNAAAAQYPCSGASTEAWQVVAAGGSGGGPTVTHSVSLNWNASTASGVVGYYIYRGTTAGGTLTKLSGKVSDTSYVDASVQAGHTYYYAATAVNAQNQESSYSNQVKTTVPTS